MEERFERQAKEVRQWMVKEGGFEEAFLEVKIQGMEAVFSYRGETMIVQGYPMEEGIKWKGEERETGGMQAAGPLRQTRGPSRAESLQETEGMQEAELLQEAQGMQAAELLQEAQGMQEAVSPQETQRMQNAVSLRETQEMQAAGESWSQGGMPQREAARKAVGADMEENPLAGQNGLWNYGRMWEYCANLLGEDGSASWSHNAYPLLANPGEQAAMLLYQTSGGAAGCMFLTDAFALRLEMGKEEREAGRLEEAKRYLEAIANIQKFVDGVETPEEAALGWNTLWSGIFRGLCSGKTPYEDIEWADGKIREAIGWELRNRQGHALLSREEIMGMETLRLFCGEEVESFHDLRYLENLRVLSVSYREAKQEGTARLLEELPKLERLTSLEIRGGELEDLAFVQELPRLEELAADGGKGLEDISPLTACQSLKRLELTGGKIRDVALLGRLTQLERLCLRGNEVNSLDGLETLGKLAFLDISDNQVEDLSPLAGLAQLEELYAGGNGISRLAPLKGMGKLRCLSLERNRIQDISALEGMEGLVSLRMEENQVEDYEPLMGMEELYFLSLDYEPWQDVGDLAKLPYLELVEKGPEETGAGNGLLQEGPEETRAGSGLLQEGPEETRAGSGLLQEGPEEMRAGNGLLQEGPEEKGAGEDGSGDGLTQEEPDEQPETGLELAQRWLDMVYPGLGAEAAGIARGDMNGDGIADMAIVGELPVEKSRERDRMDSAWYLYLVLSKRDSGVWFTMAEPVPLSGREGTDGFAYVGMAFSGGQLMVQHMEYGACATLRKTELYGYDGETMVRRWGHTLQFDCFSQEALWHVEDVGTGISRIYGIPFGEKGNRRLLYEEIDSAGLEEKKGSAER